MGFLAQPSIAGAFEAGDGHRARARRSVDVGNEGKCVEKSSSFVFVVVRASAMDGGAPDRRGCCGVRKALKG